MKKDLIIVLDLGSSKVACAAFRLNSDGEMEALAAASDDSKGIRRGQIFDYSAASSCADAVIKRVHQSAGVEISDVVVGIGGANVKGVNSQGFLPLYPRGRTITREDVLHVINHSRQISAPAGYEQVQVLPREFLVDGEAGIQSPIGLEGGRLEVFTHIVTGDSNYLRSLDHAVAETGKKVDQMVLKSLASALAVTTEHERQEGVCVADIGGGGTELAIFKNGAVLHTHWFPVGGQLVTSDVMKLLKTSPEEAERLKVQSGAASPKVVPDGEPVDVLQLGQAHPRPLHRRVLCEIVESRMREIAQMIRQEIGNSGQFGNLPGGVVVTGGGSKLAGTAVLFEDVFPEHRVRVGEPTLLGAKSDFVNNPAMATTVGLALFVARSYDDELSPAAGAGDWKERIRTFWSLVSGPA